MNPNDDSTDHQAYLEDCKEAFDEDHAHLIVGVDWTQEERDAEFQKYSEYDDDDGYADAQRDYLRDAQAEAGF